MRDFKPLLIAVIASLALGICFFSCNTEPETEYRIDLHLPDSLSRDAGKYDSLAISILDTNGQMIRANAFNGAYMSQTTGGVLKGIVLGESNLTTYVIEIRAYQDGTEKARTQIQVTGDAVSPIIRVYPVGFDSIPKPIPDPKPDSIPHSNPKPQPDTIPKGIEIFESALTLPSDGAPQLLIAKFLPAEARATVIWSTSNAEVADIGTDGLLTPKAPGSAVIYATVATFSELIDSVQVRVVNDTGLTSLRLIRPVPVLFTGGPTHKLQVTYQPDSLTPVLSWHSSDTSRVWVGLDGTLTGRQPGEAIITVKASRAGTDSSGGIDSIESVMDTVFVSVQKDIPTLDVSGDIKVEVGQIARFNLKATQLFGTLILTWDFTGDGLPEDSATKDTATATHTYAIAGSYEAVFTAKDGEGNQTQIKRRVVVGKQGPLIVITSPRHDTTVNTPQFVVRFTSDGIPMTENFGLRGGPNTLWVKASNALGIDSVSLRVTLDTVPPLAPAFDTAKTTRSPTKLKRPIWAWMRSVGGMGLFRYSLKTTPAITREDTSNSFTPSADLADGSYTLTVSERDSVGNWSAPNQQTITVNTKTPIVKILSPKPNEWTKADSVEVIWSVDSIIQSTQTSEIFSEEGSLWIVRRFTNLAGNSGSDSVTIRRDITPPKVVIISPRDSFVTSKSQTLIQWSIDGVEQPAVLKNLPDEGINVLAVNQFDSAGNVGGDTVRVFRRTKVIFVDAGKTGGDGTSWESAYGTLGEILDTTKSYEQGTQVWIAEGEYEPTHVAENNRYLFLRSNLELYGGFEPGMVALASRNRSTHRSVITGRNQWGDILVAFPRFQVRNLILDGFWFQDTWGAITMDSVQNVTIRNCVFDGANTASSRGLLLTESSVWVNQCKLMNYRHTSANSSSSHAIHLFGGSYNLESDTVTHSDIAMKQYRDSRVAVTRSRFTGNGKTLSDGTQVLPFQLSATDTLRIFTSAIQGGETSILKEPGALVEYGSDNFSP